MTFSIFAFVERLGELVTHVNRYYRSGAWDEFLRRVNRNLDHDDISKAEREFANGGLSHQTEFFRGCLRAIFEEVLPKIKDLYPLSLLSLPCSNGQETYSLVMLALEKGLGQVSGTGIDLSDEQLEIARKGEYFLTREKSKELGAEIKKGNIVPLDQLGRQHFRPNFAVSGHLKERVEFYGSDLLRSEVEGRYDVTFCLGLLMHFNEEGQNEALWNLTKNMRSGDLLVLDQPYPLVHGTRLAGAERKEWEYRRGYNQMIAGLEERLELGLRRVSSRFNVYEKALLTP